MEELAGHRPDWPRRIYAMTAAEIRAGKRVGKGHGFYRPDREQIKINPTMSALGIYLNFIHENLHHAMPEASDREINEELVPEVFRAATGREIPPGEGRRAGIIDAFYANPPDGAPPALQPVHLVVTKEQVDRARDNRAVLWLPMRPVDFIELTTPAAATELRQIGFEDWVEYFTEKAAPLTSYNLWAELGELVVPPSLRVYRDTGEISSHEGRHRAGALHREDPNAKMWVAVALLDPTGYADRRATAKDLPKELRGQFSPEVEVPLGRARERAIPL